MKSDYNADNYAMVEALLTRTNYSRCLVLGDR